MFSLWLCYYACSEEEKLFYDNLNTARIDMEPCCKNIIKNMKTENSNKADLRDVSVICPAHENGAFWSRSTLLCATVSGDTDYKRYALQNGRLRRSDYAEQYEDFICGVTAVKEERRYVPLLQVWATWKTYDVYINMAVHGTKEQRNVRATKHGHFECLKFAI